MLSITCCSTEKQKKKEVATPSVKENVVVAEQPAYSPEVPTTTPAPHNEQSGVDNQFEIVEKFFNLPLASFEVDSLNEYGAGDCWGEFMPDHISSTG